MKRPRRQFLKAAAATVAFPRFSRIAWAQTYPSRPVRLIVGYPAGGPSDIVARLIGRYLAERFGQQFIIENRSGAASNIATEAVVRAPADGYTLLMMNAANAINTTLYDNLSFNVIHDIAPVGGLSLNPYVMEINPSLPAKTVPEFITYAKNNPNNISFGSGGIGAPNHVAGELFKVSTGINMVHVPYRGEAPALTDLIGGQLQVLFGVVAASIEYIRAGTLRPLAVTSATRMAALSDVPTVGEFIPGYEASQWYGVGAPKDTPFDIIERLNMEIDISLADAKLSARLADLGGVPLPMTPSDFGKHVVREAEKWAKVVKLAGLKAQ
jgi:tripartite-type tricarboxylate transporter receptor subunit TctC